MDIAIGWGLEPPDEPTDPSPEDGAVDKPVPVMPDEVIEDTRSGEWQRRLVLPNQDGELRVLPVSRARRRSA
jgi:hypothetical protein